MKEIKMVTIRNAKGNMIDVFEATETERLAAYMNRAEKRGWKWTVTEWTDKRKDLEEMEWWELAGNMTDPTKTHYGPTMY